MKPSEMPHKETMKTMFLGNLLVKNTQPNSIPIGAFSGTPKNMMLAKQPTVIFVKRSVNLIQKFQETCFYFQAFNKARDFSYGVFSVGCSCPSNITYGK